MHRGAQALGRGFLESVYKETLQYEFQQRSIVFEREKKLKSTIKRLF